MLLSLFLCQEVDGARVAVAVVGGWSSCETEEDEGARVAPNERADCAEVRRLTATALDRK